MNSDMNDNAESESDDGFRMVTRKRTRSGSGSDRSMGKQIRVARSSEQVSDSVMVFVSCQDFNLAKANPLLVAKWLKERVGEVAKVWPVGSDLKVQCTQAQANLLKKCKNYEKKQIRVKIIEHRVEKKAMLFGVPVSIPTDDIRKFSSIIEKAVRYPKQGLPSETVCITFEKSVVDIPDQIYLGYLKFRCHEYVPQPRRCFKCQRYGHVSVSCNATRRCAKCGEDHGYDECQQGQEQLKCCNCGENHSAAYKGCKEYHKAKEVVEVKIDKKISYAQAASIVRNNAAQRVVNTGRQEQVIDRVPETQVQQIDSVQIMADKIEKLQIQNENLVVAIAKLFFLVKKDVFVRKDGRLQQLVRVFNEVGGFNITIQQLQKKLDGKVYNGDQLV